MLAIVIWFVIWIVIGLLVGALASVVTKSDPPYGIGVDIGASVLTMIIVGLGDYFIMPLIGIEGTLRFAITILEPIAGVVLVLWLLRFIKRRGQKLAIVTPAPIAVILGSLAFVISAYAWGKGENLYVLFLSGYRFIFGSGI